MTSYFIRSILTIVDSVTPLLDWNTKFVSTMEIRRFASWK